MSATNSVRRVVKTRQYLRLLVSRYGRTKISPLGIEILQVLIKRLRDNPIPVELPTVSLESMDMLMMRCACNHALDQDITISMRDIQLGVKTVARWKSIARAFDQLRELGIVVREDTKTPWFKFRCKLRMYGMLSWELSKTYAERVKEERYRKKLANNRAREARDRALLEQWKKDHPNETLSLPEQ
jgi:hypothetical protein